MWPGWYCAEFECWNQAFVRHGFCRAHGGKDRRPVQDKPGTALGSDGAAWLGLELQAPLFHQAQELIQHADVEQLRLIVAAAVDRLAIMASRPRVSE